MTRENYERFIQLFHQEQSKYKILALETDDHYYNNFIKIVDSTTRIVDTRNTKTYDSGIFIDIFPMDSFNDTKVMMFVINWKALNYCPLVSIRILFMGIAS